MNFIITLNAAVSLLNYIWLTSSNKTSQKKYFDVIHWVFIESWSSNTHLKNTSAFSLKLLEDIVTVGFLDATHVNHNFPI